MTDVERGVRVFRSLRDRAAVLLSALEG